MKVVSRLIIGLIVIITINSCKYECDGFPNHELAWIPYEIGEKIKYTNGLDTIEFEVVDYAKTEPDYFRGLVMDYECSYEGYYSTDESKNYYIKEKLNNGWKDSGMKVWLSDNDLFHFYMLGQNETSDSLTIEFMTDLNIEGIMYNDVYKVTKNKPIDLNRILWIIKARDKGIVQFYDKKLEEKWTLIE